MRTLYTLALSLLVLFPCSLAALTIDEFNDQMSINPQQGNPSVEVSASLITSSAVGGTRSLRGKVTSLGAPQGADIFIATYSGRFSFSEDSGISGYARLLWDGDNNANNLVYNGLAGIDLTQDGATALAIEVVSYDLGLPLPIQVTLHDASDPNRVSWSTYNIPGQVNSLTTIIIPFLALSSAPGAIGEADLTNIGAITLSIEASGVPAADLQLEWIGTNGACRLVPDEFGKVIDICGVCGGDGTSCLDCAGVPFGDAELDRCGVCQGDGMSCVTCFDTDVSEISATLDGGAKKLEKHIQEAARRLRKARPDKKTDKFIRKTLKEVHRLQIDNWVLSWIFPRTMTTCDNEQFCTFSSYQSTADTYRIQNEQMRQLGLQVIRRLRSVNRAEATRAARYLKKIEAQTKANYDESFVVPVKDFTC